MTISSTTSIKEPLLLQSLFSTWLHDQQTYHEAKNQDDSQASYQRKGIRRHLKLGFGAARLGEIRIVAVLMYGFQSTNWQWLLNLLLLK